MLDDLKTRTALAGLLAMVLIQFLHSKNVEWLDADTAKTLCLGVLGLAAALIGGHAHVEHAETVADGHVEAAVAARGPAPPIATDKP